MIMTNEELAARRKAFKDRNEAMKVDLSKAVPVPTEPAKPTAEPTPKAALAGKAKKGCGCGGKKGTLY